MTVAAPQNDQLELNMEKSEDIAGLSPELMASVNEALEDGKTDLAKLLVDTLHYADLADLLEGLRHDHRGRAGRCAKERV